MPVLIIGGDGPKDEKPMAKMAPRKGGIGGKFSEPDSTDTETAAPTEEMDARKREAAKLLLRAIKNDDPTTVADAITTLVDCCDSAEQDDSGETE